MMTERKVRGAARSRLMWLGGALAVAGAVQAQIDVFGAWLTPQQQGLLTMLVGVAVAWLRWVTTQPLDER